MIQNQALERRSIPSLDGRDHGAMLGNSLLQPRFVRNAIGSDRIRALGVEINGFAQLLVIAKLEQ